MTEETNNDITEEDVLREKTLKSLNAEIEELEKEESVEAERYLTLLDKREKLEDGVALDELDIDEPKDEAIGNWRKLTDMMVDGFEKLDDNLIELNPPRIKFEKGFMDKAQPARLLYLVRLASSMNHAAKIIMGERDEAVRIGATKEAQLVKMNEALQNNNKMLAEQTTRFNAKQQSDNDHIQNLNNKIRELKQSKTDLEKKLMDNHIAF